MLIVKETHVSDVKDKAQNLFLILSSRGNVIVVVGVRIVSE